MATYLIAEYTYIVHAFTFNVFIRIETTASIFYRVKAVSKRFFVFSEVGKREEHSFAGMLSPT